MAKLSSLKPRLGSKADHHKRLDAEQPWRRWYYTKRWQRIREAVWLRDRYTCQRTGMICIGKYPAPDSPVANHKVPHKGDPALFWDIDNIETVAKSVHDGQVQAEEKTGFVKGSGLDGRPLDPSHPWNR